MAAIIVALLVLDAPRSAMADGPLRPAWPIDVYNVDDQASAIEWRDGWHNTAEATRERWQEQLQGVDPRGDRWDVRMVYLAHRLAERFPAQRERKLEAFRDAVDRLERIDERRRGEANSANTWRWRIVQTFADEPAVVHEALADLLRNTTGGWQWREWVRLAAGHLDERRAAGAAVPDELEAALLRRMADVLASEGRHAEASLHIARLGQLEADPWRYALHVATQLRNRDQPWVTHRYHRQVLDRLPADHPEREGVAATLAGIPALDEVDVMVNLPGSGLTVAQHRELWETADLSSAETVRRLLQSLPNNNGLAKDGVDRVTTVWPVVFAVMADQPAAVRTVVQQAQQAEAERLADRAAAEDDPVLSAMKLFRAAPWAVLSHQSMLAAAEIEWRHGGAALAERLLRDVQRYSPDEALRSRAAEALATLRSMADATPPPTEATPQDVAWQWLKRPAMALWPETFFRGAPRPIQTAMETMPSRLVTAADEGATLLAGPEGILCYDSAAGTLRWARTPTWSSASPDHEPISRDELPAFGRFEPSVDTGVVYSRWGLDPHRRFPTDLVALSLDDGSVRWSTQGDAAWKAWVPVNDPVVAGGRLYVLTAAYTGEQRQVMRDIAVHCLDAATGETIWHRTLGHGNPNFHYRLSLGWHIDIQINPATYGHRLLVHKGAIYCQTNMGLLARLDARDGQLEWVRRYERSDRGSWRRLFKRLGSHPVVVDDVILFAPRDGMGVTAVDRETGALRWFEPLLPAEQMTPLNDRHVILAEGASLACINSDDGTVRWALTFDSDIRGRAHLLGAQVWLATAEGVKVIDPTTGQLVQHHEADLTDAFDITPLERGRVGVVGHGPEAFAGDHQFEPAPHMGLLTGDPEPTWHSAGVLRRAVPRLWSSDESNATGSLVVLSDGLIERLSDTEPGEVQWTRRLRPGMLGRLWHEDTLVLIYADEVIGIDADTGQRKWDIFRTDFEVHVWHNLGSYLLLQNSDDFPRYGHLAVIDLQTGQPLWQRHLRTTFFDFAQQVRPVFNDGLLHLIMFSVRPYEGPGQTTHVRLDPETGLLRQIDRISLGEQTGLIREAETDGRALWTRRFNPVRLLRYVPGDEPQQTRFAASDAFDDVRPHRVQWLDHAPWRLLRHPEQGTLIYHANKPATVHFRDRNHLLRLVHPYYFEADDGRVQRFDLLDGAFDAEPVTYQLTPPANGHDDVQATAAHRVDDQLQIVSGIERPRHRGPAYLQIDRFNFQTGEAVAHQQLPGVYPWHVEAGTMVHLRDDALFVATPEAVSLYRKTGSSPSRLRRKSSAFEGLRIKRMDDRLIIRLRQPAHAATPLRGEGGFLAGTALELAIDSGDAAHRWILGIDPAGRLIWRSHTDASVPDGALGIARHDPHDQTFDIRLELPLDAVTHRDGENSILCFAVRWHEDAGVQRLRPAIGPTVGGGVTNWSVHSGGFRRIVLPASGGVLPELDGRGRTHDGSEN
ncbi:MAG: PQQ-binding-like beta-propeller repeat protein [Phycisphaeraceae bacterium]